LCNLHRHHHYHIEQLRRGKGAPLCPIITTGTDLQTTQGSELSDRITHNLSWEEGRELVLGAIKSSCSFAARVEK
jgi:hypothetical protein